MFRVDKGNSMTRDEIINVFLVRAPSRGERERLSEKLYAMTKEQLEEAYRVLQIQAKIQANEEEYLRIEVERAADRIIHQLEMDEFRAPQRKAEAERQEKLDRETFKQAARSLKSFGVTDANLSVTRSTLGPNFTVYSIQQALASNTLNLSPPTQEEVNEWARADIEAYNLKLLSLDTLTLRKLAREAGARGIPVSPLDETQRIRQAERAEGIAYLPLPDEFRDGNGPEEALDAAFIRKCSPETYRLLLRRYGSLQIDEALRTRRPDASSMW
jgi:hypothetical protein